jgi:hypothetical protein
VDRNSNTQKLIRPVVLKDVGTYYEQLLVYGFLKFWVRLAVPRPVILKKWRKCSKFYSFSEIFFKSFDLVYILTCSTILVNTFEEKLTLFNPQWYDSTENEVKKVKF